jgi:predicted dehydrogenase
LLNAAVIGLGVGEQHALSYQEHPRCTLTWLCDLSPDKLKSVAQRFPGAHLTTQAAELFERYDIDIVSIATFDDFHCAQVIAALKTGKHVFVEKPLCRSTEELEAIQNQWQANPRLRLQANLVLRTAPLYCKLRDQIQEGILGEIYAFDGDYLYGRLHKITDGWRKDVESYSVMQGGGIHLLDLMVWLTGQKPETVTAVGNRISTADTAFRYNDFMSATFQFPSGLVGRITANFGSVHKHQHVLRIFGTKATFLYDDQGARLYTNRDASISAERIDQSPQPPNKGALIPAFVDSILSSTDGTLETQHEFDIMTICFAADQAAKLASTVRINYL